MAEESEKLSGDVWIGSSLGMLKGISLSGKECLNYLPAGLTISQTDKTKEVLCMCWEYGSKDKLYMGLRNSAVLCFDCNQKYFSAECDLSGGTGNFIGLAKYEKTLITCTNEGTLSFWPDSQEKIEIDVGKNIFAMSASPDEPLLVATGGQENDMKLWDGTRPDASPVFKARNVPEDYLRLRVPVWVRATGIVSGTGNRPLVAVATGYHQVRLYDTRAQRRPVYSHSWGESSFTCLELTQDGRYYLVGNAYGEIARIDLRKGEIVNKYHGFGGSVRSISSFTDDTSAVFAACGLDRYVRVYRMEPPAVIYKKYLKLHCNSILISTVKTGQNNEEKYHPSSVAGIKRSASNGCEEESGDELWEGMEKIEEEPVKRKIKLTSKKKKI